MSLIASAAPATIDPKGSPDQLLADITRAEWEMFKTQFAPVEQKAIDQATSSVEPAANRAGDYAAKGSTIAGNVMQRDLGRAGVSLTPAQQAALTRRRMIGGSVNVANAENTTRRTQTDLNTNYLATIAGLGRGVANTATGGLTTAANAETQRNATNQQISSANKAQTYSTIGTIAGAALMFL